MILKKKKAAKADQPVMRNAYYDVVRQPVITEKSTAASEQGKVMFEVAQGASKTEIKAAVEALFSVKVTAVNTLVRMGKVKRFKGVEGRKSDRKLAVITLAEGQKIDFSSGVR